MGAGPKLAKGCGVCTKGHNFFLTDLHIPAWHLCRRACLSSSVAHARASFKFRMSKKSSKSGKKTSLGRGHHQDDDEFALDLVDSSAAPAKLKRITINDDDDEVSGPAIKQENCGSKQPNHMHTRVKAAIASLLGKWKRNFSPEPCLPKLLKF